MAILTESVHTGEFLVSEANNTLSREQVKLGPSQELLSGTVLGQITGHDITMPHLNGEIGTYVPLSLVGMNGVQIAAGILYNNTTTGNDGGEAVIIARNAEVDQHLLIWPSEITEEKQEDAINKLAELGIILR